MDGYHDESVDRGHSGGAVYRRHTGYAVLSGMGVVEMKAECTEVLIDELRQLLFWASVGVRHSRGGSYQSTISSVINDYAKTIGYELTDYAPVFEADIGEGK